MNYTVKLKDKIVLKTNEKQEALHIIATIFKQGRDDVYLIGGKIGSWR